MIFHLREISFTILTSFCSEKRMEKTSHHDAGWGCREVNFKSLLLVKRARARALLRKQLGRARG